MDINSILHSVASSAKTPVLWLLLALLVITAFLTGSALSEAILRRRKPRAVPEIIKRINSCEIDGLEDVIRSSRLTNIQQEALLGVIDTKELSDEMRADAAQSLLAVVESRYMRIVNYTELVVKIAPMAGLMGTLIPLGPGIMALGRGDTQTLSESIITAFDTTVAGLISAGFATIISSVRKQWYRKYISDTESLIECLLEKLHGGEV